MGGFVRDKILNRPCMDIDIVCLGDANELALELSKQYSLIQKFLGLKIMAQRMSASETTM